MDLDLRVVSASERLDRIEFNPGSEWLAHAIQLGSYRCPHCGCLSELHTGTLRQHEHDRKHLDPSPWGQSCARLRPLAAAWEWFLDFSCMGCGAPVRLFYGHGGEYSMGSHKYRLLEVVETATWSKGDEAPWVSSQRRGV